MNAFGLHPRRFERCWDPDSDSSAQESTENDLPPEDDVVEPEWVSRTRVVEEHPPVEMSDEIESANSEDSDDCGVVPPSQMNSPAFVGCAFHECEARPGVSTWFIGRLGTSPEAHPGEQARAAEP
jgi:hypothetical protein